VDLFGGSSSGNANTATSADPTGLDQVSASSGAAQGVTTQETPLPEDSEAEYRRWVRYYGLHEQNSLRGSTGLMRVREAGSGPVGTFRFAILGGFYSGSDFLCTDSAPCRNRATGQTLVGDDTEQIQANVTLSATPFSFLEAYAGLYNSATSMDLGNPQLLQVLGDANLGLKLFTPAEADRLYSFGGEAELVLFNGTGGVGLDGGSTSFALRLLGSLDFYNRTNESDRIPLRLHLNAGYFFDNSAAMVEDLETNPPPAGRGEPIERNERFGLGLARVDSLDLGLGAEYIHEYLRPFAEYTVDVPVNRQNYVCDIESAAERGDRCLGSDGSFKSTPSRLTVGTRVFPWSGTGLALTAAIDIGLTGTATFLEETTPELPYNIWFGVAYAVDTVPPEPVVQRVEVVKQLAVPAAQPRRYVVGTVTDATTGAPIPDAILRYEGRPLTGMVAGPDGAFRSTDLEPGTYTLSVFAEGFKQGSCPVTIPAAAVAQATTPPPNAAVPGAATQPAAPPPGNAPAGDIEVPVSCKLDELPKVANITGILIDAETNAPIAGATVKITDKLGRELELAADEAGAFQFRNVPLGSAKVTANAPGYMSAVQSFNIESRKDIELRLPMNKRPENPNVVVTARELKLKKQVHFMHDSADILPDSEVILEEIAEVLKEHGEIARIEIQGHTDNTGPADYNRKLSQQRAEAVAKGLQTLGIAPGRLTAKGYGPDKPLVPNVSEGNRAKNRRVQLIVLERE
jgi:outer membrane protein OmpA-like peptidoglycan-associated protein